MVGPEDMCSCVTLEIDEVRPKSNKKSASTSSGAKQRGGGHGEVSLLSYLCLVSSLSLFRPWCVSSLSISIVTPPPKISRSWAP